MKFLFLFFFIFSTQLSAAQFNDLQTSQRLSVNELQALYTQYTALFEKVTGHCARSAQLGFERTAANQRLINVARGALYHLNTGYDRPGRLNLSYHGALSSESDSLTFALKHMLGGKNFNYALQFFRNQNDQASAKKLFVLRDELQKALTQLASDGRLLVYAGDATQSFGAFEFSVLLDPQFLEAAVFQAGWCE